MIARATLPAFAGYGIELEYMIVDRETLSVLPVADRLLRALEGASAGRRVVCSNELVLHLVEIKNPAPHPLLEPLPAFFQAEVQGINELLAPMGGQLMPAAMHPWMDPLTETRLWPLEHAAIYQAYDRIFDCRRHGWANLQSMHLNLPFADDHEFSRLFAAIRLVLPILPALAASSPIAEGRDSGFLDLRMENYRQHPLRIPSIIGKLIPDTVTSRAEHESKIMAPMYRDLLPLDPEGVLRHEWLNQRGAIPRFDRNAIEIRVIDTQECPQADLAIAAATVAVVRALYDATWTPLAEQQGIATDALLEVMLACIRDAEQAEISDAAYLQLLGFPGRRCVARELWRHLIESTLPGHGQAWQARLELILEHGPLARRILRALGHDFSKARLAAVYRELCDCLDKGQMFLGLT